MYVIATTFRRWRLSRIFYGESIPLNNYAKNTKTFLRRVLTAHACPPTREVSKNVDGSTNPGAWVHPYEDSNSKKGVPRLHSGLDISSNERANGTRMATFIHSIINTRKSSFGPTFMNILTSSWMSSYLNDGYLTCKEYAELPYCFRSTRLRLHVYRTNQILQGRYSDVDTTSWVITEHTHKHTPTSLAVQGRTNKAKYCSPSYETWTTKRHLVLSCNGKYLHVSCLWELPISQFLRDWLQRKDNQGRRT